MTTYPRNVHSRVYGNALMDSKRDANSRVARLALRKGLSPLVPQPEAPAN